MVLNAHQRTRAERALHLGSVGAPAQAHCRKQNFSLTSSLWWKDLSLLAIRTYVTVSSLELTKREIVMLMH
jgi:hypothetical protein